MRDCEHGQHARKCPICEATADVGIWKNVAAKLAYIIVGTENDDPESVREDGAARLLAACFELEQEKIRNA